MILQAHRFHGHNSLNVVYRSGNTLRGTQLNLKYKQRPAGRDYRLAVVVSRKVSKSAVRRNRIRRRIYELIRKQEAAFLNPYDMVFVVFSDEFIAMESSQLATNVYGLLQKAAILPTNDRS